MSYTQISSNNVAITDSSPLSPAMLETSQTIATEIPVYSVSDSDEDRANTFMKNMTQTLLTNPVVDNSNPGCSREPDITDSDLVQVVDISEERAEHETPSVKVLFMNTDIGRKYRHDIEEFFHTLMTTENLSRDREPLAKIQRRPNLKPPDGEDFDSKSVQPTTVIGAISVYRTFMMDRLGWPMIANMLHQTPGTSIPDYTQLFAETYPPPEDSKILENKPLKTSKKCFNCGEDGHEVAKCSKPFDKRTFTRNRAKFKATGLQYGRYHKEENKKKMKPGELSPSLRQALGLQDEELPQHIYRMRRMGYPPGWLLHAEATNSGLAMFDKVGKEVDLDGDCMEDGQVPEHRIRDEANLKYNSDQLIMYAGFNVACPPAVEDKALSRRGYPSMKPEHSLDVMSSNINIVEEESPAGGETSHKRNRYDSASHNPKRFKASHIDMDLSDGEDDAGSTGIEIIEIPSGQADEEEDDDIQEFQVVDELSPGSDTERTAADNSKPSDSLSVLNINNTINALEETKQKLLAELQEMEGGMTASTPAQPAVGGAYSVAPPIVLDLEEEVETPQPSYQSMSYLVTTPVIQHSGINRLPSYDKFSDGITDHLPYENLPNATGVYQKMSGIMKDVKDRMAVIRPNRTAKK